MEFIIEKSESGYIMKEDDRVIFTCDCSYDEKLLSVYLRNVYGDEALAVYQIKKWYSTVVPSITNDFTIYEGDNKMGELHKTKGGFEFAYQGVLYRFYGGEFESVKKVICFDRTHQCAEMMLEEPSIVRFSNSTLGALMALLCVVLKECSLTDQFSQEMFLEKHDVAYCA